MERPSRRAVLAGFGGAVSVSLAGCRGESGATRTATQATLSPDARYAYTHVQPSGNRVLDGSGSIHEADPVTFDIDGEPAWLLAFPGERGSLWTVLTRAGSARTVRVADGSAATVTDHASLPAAMPPLARRSGDGVGLVRPPADAAARTHPVVTDAGLLYVAADGDLVLRSDGESQRWAVDALLDGRIVHVGDSRYALYTDVTDRYRHGALGDDREGTTLLVFDADKAEVTTQTTLASPAVFEGLAPLVADLDGDGTAELVTTVADSSDGARIAVFDRDGTRLATGPIYGPGWRHQLAVADFGAGRPELAVTRKPHVDHVVEFYALDAGSLSITATYPGVRSHTYASRNLDGALAGDLDGDGTAELLVPTVDRQTLVAVERTDDGAGTDWQRSLDGGLTTNLTGVDLSDGRVAVGAGTERGVRIWQG